MKAVHEHMSSLVQEVGGKIDCIVFCPHEPKDNCSCRKPETGTFRLRSKNELESSLKNSFFIGDKESDLLCATKHGCIPLLVETGYGGKTLTSKHCPPKERCFKDLMEAVSYVLES